MKRLINKALQARWGKKGQSTAEYIIIVALVAIGSIAMITIFGNQIRALFSVSAEQLSGDDAATLTDEAAGATGEVQKDLDNY